MKKNNIKQLKEIVSNEIFFDLSYQGMQAYNISANEYEVIIGFWKCNGRFYFVDRNNNKYLASRYDRAEFIAGEMLEQKARENGETAATCEPSFFAGILAKVKDFAKAAAEKAAFVLSLVVFFAFGLLSIYISVFSVASIVEALGICGSIWGALIGSALVLTVGLDFMAFVAINTMAVLARIFPSEFEKAQKPRFTKPFSFWYRLISESL